MNRRTFLKTTGMTIIGITTIGKAKPTLPKGIADDVHIQYPMPAWIRLTERFPDPDQKIILAQIGCTGLEGGIIAEAPTIKAKSNGFYLSIIMTDLDFVQCFGDRHEDYVINYVYSDEGEKVLRSRKWLDPTVKKEYSYHKAMRWSRIHALYTLDECIWLPVNGDYPIEIPPIPLQAPTTPHPSQWRPFSGHMPKSCDNIEIRDQIGVTAKGRYIVEENEETHKEYDYFMPDKKHRDWLNVNIIGINKPFWSWRYNA